MKKPEKMNVEVPSKTISETTSTTVSVPLIPVTENILPKQPVLVFEPEEPLLPIPVFFPSLLDPMEITTKEMDPEITSLEKKPAEYKVPLENFTGEKISKMDTNSPVTEIIKRTFTESVVFENSKSDLEVDLIEHSSSTTPSPFYKQKYHYETSMGTVELILTTEKPEDGKTTSTAFLYIGMQAIFN